MIRAMAVATLALALSACGASGPHSPSATASPSPAPSASPPATPPTAASTVTPSPDTEQVEVIASGIGAHDLQVVPVAMLHNEAGAHTADEVVVSFTVNLSGGSYSLTAAPVSLAPGETLADAVLCTDACDGATGTVVAVTVGSWSPGGRTVISASGAAYACGSPCGGGSGYQGDVTGTLSGSVPSGALVNLFAVCQSSAATIVGGGLSETMWAEATSVSASVPVLVSVRPASCQLYASEVG